MQLEVFEHFTADNHNRFWNDCSITLLIEQMVQVPREGESTGEKF